MTDQEKDNSLRRLQWASLVVCGILLVMVIFTLLFTVASKNSANAVQKGNDAATCRSQFSSQVTDARTNLDNARADVALAEFDGLAAATVDPNPAAVEAAVEAGRAAKAEVVRYQAQASRANSAYQELLAAEVDDPARFEQLCTHGPT